MLKSQGTELLAAVVMLTAMTIIWGGIAYVFVVSVFGFG
jgi:hypothetical protein